MTPRKRYVVRQDAEGDWGVVDRWALYGDAAFAPFTEWENAVLAAKKLTSGFDVKSDYCWAEFAEPGRG